MKKIIVAAILILSMGALLSQTKIEDIQKPLYTMQKFTLSYNLKDLASAD